MLDLCNFEGNCIFLNTNSKVIYFLAQLDIALSCDTLREMIDRIYFNNPKLKEYYKLESKKFSGQYSIKLLSEKNNVINDKISFIIQFHSAISAYRDTSYKWIKLTNKEVYLNAHSSKIIVLKDGTHFL